MKTLWCKNQENQSDRISHAWAPLILDFDQGSRCLLSPTRNSRIDLKLINKNRRHDQCAFSHKCGIRFCNRSRVDFPLFSNIMQHGVMGFLKKKSIPEKISFTG